MHQISAFFSKLFESSDWPARWHDARWSQFHGWLYIIGDLLAGSACLFAIIAVIKYFPRKPGRRMTSIYFMLIVTILACGSVQILDAITFWIPVYRLNALALISAGMLSWFTLIFLVRFSPFAASLKSIQILEARSTFQLLVSSVKDYAIFMIDKEGHVSSWNSGAENLKGYTAKEIIGQSIDIFYTQADIQQDIPTRNLALALQNGHLETKGWRVRKDGSVFYANVVFTPLVDENGIFCGFAKIIKDITERKKAESDMNALNAGWEQRIHERTDALGKLNAELQGNVGKRTEELLAANQEMEAFTYSVSHDLRAPLRGIIGFTTILEEDHGSQLNDEARRITSIIKKNTLKMGCLIDDLLTFSRMGKQDIVKTAIDTRGMVDEVISTLLSNPTHNQIQWEVEDLPAVCGDFNTIRQVWVNLISNAIKYSGKGETPRITIGSFVREEQLSFFVKDNGVGFNNRYKHKLFKVFQRLHSADQFEGTGVGLALVAKIIAKHDGKVWAEGEEGKNACFYFSLPVLINKLS
jgi:PAS domain S-box-containing protein